MKPRSIDHWVRARTKSSAVRHGLDPSASYSLVQAFADFSEHRRGEVREIFPPIALQTVAPEALALSNILVSFRALRIHPFEP